MKGKRLENKTGLIAVGVFVGVVFTRQIAVGLLDLLVACVWRDTKHRIWIIHV